MATITHAGQEALDQVLPKISLEQWAVFRAVVEEGSYARAAERLNKSQSGVSYALSKMESRLPAAALRLHGRKAELTDVGTFLYRRACALLDQAHAIDRSVALLAAGWEEEVSIAVDALVSMSKVLDALATFSQRCEQTRVRLFETTLSGTDEAILERRVQLAITPNVPTGFLAQPLWQERMLAVVSADHPLALQDGKVSEHQLMGHRQIVLRDSGSRRQQSQGWLHAEQRWTVSHFSTSIEAVKAGLGFAFIPENRIKHELQIGTLKPIALEHVGERTLTLNMVLVDQSEAGPAVKELATILRAV